MTSELVQFGLTGRNGKFQNLIEGLSAGIVVCAWNPERLSLVVRQLNSIASILLHLDHSKTEFCELRSLPTKSAVRLASLGEKSMLTGCRLEDVLVTDNGELKVVVYPVAEDELAIVLSEGERHTTDYAEINKDLREWEKTFDAIGDLVTIQDKDMRIIRANRTAHEMFGLRPGSLEGEKCFLAFQGYSEPCPMCPVLKTSAECKYCSGLIYNEKLQRTFDVRSSPITSESGELKWIVHIARDVTRESALERQLQQAMKMEAIGTLAGGIAHDFNNILSAIIGYGYIAKGKLEKDSPIQADLEQILSGADRAVDLVKQILTFARQESQEQLSPLRIQYIVKEVLKLMRSSLPATIELVQQVDNSCSPIMADPGQIHQLLMNLCTNGKQAIGAGHGKLSIALREADAEDLVGFKGLESLTPGRYAYLAVQDNGCGMDRQMLERIFDPFYTTRIKEHGTGLGLAVVHGIVKKHNGLIGVESEPEVGATFHVAFPVTETLRVQEVHEVAAVSKGNERIMVVDDEVQVGNVLRTMLTRMGYTVSVYSNSLEAVSDFRDDPKCCDLVLTDMTMPNMTGSELAREVMSLRPDLPVVMLTGYSEVIDREKALHIGIREFLLKPVKKNVLARALREVLDGGPNFDH